MPRGQEIQDCCNILSASVFTTQKLLLISFLPQEQNWSSANNLILTTLEDVYYCWICHRLHQGTEMLIYLMYFKLLWETYIWAYYWVNMTVRIIETIHGKEEQHRFSDGKVNNRVIVGLHIGLQQPYCWRAVCKKSRSVSRLDVFFLELDVVKDSDEPPQWVCRKQNRIFLFEDCFL